MCITLEPLRQVRFDEGYYKIMVCYGQQQQSVDHGLLCPPYPSQGLVDLLDFLLKTTIQVINSSNAAIPPKTAMAIM